MEPDSNIVVARQAVGMPPRVGNADPAASTKHAWRACRCRWTASAPAVQVNSTAFGAASSRIVRRPSSSMAGWRAAVRPLMRPIPDTRDSLADLNEIRAGRWPIPQWAVLVRARRAEVERRLLDVSMAMNALVTAERDSTDAAVSFRSDGAKLAEAARRSERAHRQ